MDEYVSFGVSMQIINNQPIIEESCWSQAKDQPRSAVFTKEESTLEKCGFQRSLHHVRTKNIHHA